MSRPETHSTEALLAQFAWVQRLAYRLCADADLAQDISQEAILAGIQRPPHRSKSLRAWLSAVVRNQLHMAGRRQALRRELEKLADAPVESPSPASLLESVATQRLVVDAVMDLVEPYRTTILRRYFEDLSPAEIATRQGLSPATVKSRLARARAQLEQVLASRLGHDHSDGAGWQRALLPLAAQGALRLAEPAASGLPLPPSPPLPGPWPSIVVMSTQKAVLFGALTLVLVLCGIQLWNSADNTDPLAPGALSSPRLAAAELAPSAEEQTGPHSEAPRTGLVGIHAQEAETDPPPPEAPNEIRVRALVIDLQGEPVPGATVLRIQPDQPREQAQALGATNSQGVLEFVQQFEAAFLFVRSPTAITLIDGTVQPVGSSASPTIVVAPPRSVHGIVTAADGQPVVGAKVSYLSTVDPRTLLDRPLDRGSRLQWLAESGPGGVFHMDLVPELPGGILSANHVEHMEASLSVPQAGDQRVEIRLGDLADAADILVGRVLDGADSPVPGAFVSLGFGSAQSQADGRFQLNTAGEPGTTLRAVVRGLAPAVLVREEGEDWPEFIVLRLGQPALTIAGRVLDGDDAPVPGVHLSLLDPEVFGAVPLGPDRLQTMVVPVEAVMAGGDLGTETDGEGRFVIQGLQPRRYRIGLESKSDLRIGRSAWIEAGSKGVLLRLPSASEPVELMGVIVDDQNQPIPRLRLSVDRTLAGDAGADLPEITALGSSVLTELDGTFRFAPVQPGGLRLSVYGGAEYDFTMLDVDAFDDPSEIRIELPRSAAFFVEATDEGPHALNVLDDDGEEVGMLQIEGQGLFRTRRGLFTGRRSPVYRLPPGDYTLVLSTDGEETTRAPLTLVSGQVKAVDL